MSIATYAAQINSAKLNVQTHQVSSKVADSAFFDMLQSLVGGNTKNISSDSSILSDSKSYDRIGTKSEESNKLLSGTKRYLENQAASHVKSPEKDIVSDDRKALESVDIENVVRISLDSDDKETENTIDAQDIQIDIAKLMQLLGVPADTFFQIFGGAENSDSDMNLLNINAVQNTSGASFARFIALNANNNQNVNINANASISSEDSFDSMLVNLDEAVAMLNNIVRTDSESIQGDTRQIISEFVGKLESVMDDISNINNISDMFSQGMTTADIKDRIVGYIQESMAAKAQVVTGNNSALNLNQSADTAAQRISVLLEENKIDVQTLKETSDVKVTASDDDRTQNIIDILSSIRNSRMNPAKISDISNAVSKAGTTDNADIIPQPQLFGSKTVYAEGESEAQTHVLTQMATNIKQGSVEALNRAVSGNFENVINTGADTSTDADSVHTALSGIVNVRGAETVNNGAVAVGKQNIVELKTHITDVANEISNMVAKNRAEGNFEIKLKLLPEGLGEVLVKVVYNRGNVDLNIVTENKLAETQLMNQVESLKESLASHDFNLSGFDVGTRSNSDGRYNQQNENQNGNRRRNLQNNFNQHSANSDDTNSVQNIQRANSLYLNRIIYKTV